MIGTYSISRLTQSFNVLDDTPRGSFEHLILLYHFTEDVNADETSPRFSSMAAESFCNGEKIVPTAVVNGDDAL